MTCLPLLASFGFYHGPNLMPVAALIAICWPTRVKKAVSDAKAEAAVAAAA